MGGESGRQRTEVCKIPVVDGGHVGYTGGLEALRDLSGRVGQANKLSQLPT